MKDVDFRGDSLDQIRSFPTEVQSDLGYQLHQVQIGEEPDSWKPMKTIGPGVKEIRIAATGNQYRAIYITKIGDTVYILHAFQKKTQKTSKKDIDLAKKRMKELKESK
jgi:phage-related protein